MAHADLQHGNVLLVPGSTANSTSVKLIDYDGTWVPSLARQKSGEVGHPAYQHPQRAAERIYSVDVDRFSHLVIYTALRGLMVGGAPLWELDKSLGMPGDLTRKWFHFVGFKVTGTRIQGHVYGKDGIEDPDLQFTLCEHP